MEANETLAYIAGIIDGEGTISVAVLHSKSNRTHNTIYVKIGNTCEDMISYINALLPGGVSEVPGKKGIKTLYTIQWYGESAIEVIELVLPYLIIKRSVAELALDMWQRCFANRYRTSALTDAERILRSKYVERMRCLNRRGANS